MDLDFESLSLREFIQIQNELTAAMTRRFQRKMALGFSDVVGSTEYFGRFGDAAGRALQQRHIDLLQKAIDGAGRIVDTAGDGAFVCFASMDSAATTFIQLERAIDRDNALRPAEQHLSIRVGLHFGAVLADGEVVSGDAVNVCARIAATAAPREIRVSREVFLELAVPFRISCRSLPPVTLKGVPAALNLMTLDWFDPKVFPTVVRIHETGKKFELPNQPTITFGRLAELDAGGTKANDIVLTLPNGLSERISRWHFELRRQPDGIVLRSLSDSPTVVDGNEVPNRCEAPIRSGSVVTLSGVMTLTFMRSDAGDCFQQTIPTEEVSGAVLGKR
jgi:class 3 adenylate cyclase